MVVTLTTAAKNWLAINAGVSNCFSHSGVSYVVDATPRTGSTGDVVNALYVSHLLGLDTTVVSAGMDYSGIKALNGGVDLTMGSNIPGVYDGDVKWAYANDGTTSGISAYCVAPADIVSTALTLSTTSCTEPCNVTGSVSWINNGGIAGTFDPAILINSASTSLGTAVTLNPGQTETRGFSLPSDLSANTYVVCASPGTHCQTLVVSHTPANVISATLTVNTNDCTVSCTINGTVSWTNNGGTASSEMNLGVTVNDTLTVLASGISIAPGATTDPYPFSLTPEAGTYTICASPDSGTTCQVVTVKTPADITTTNMTLSHTTCIEPCSINVDVTYMNSGQTAGEFTPEITIDGVSMPLTPETLGAGVSVVKTFALTDKTIGEYTICAVPLGATACQTLTVTAVQEAGMGGIMVLGLAVGALLIGKKKSSDSERKGKVEGLTIKQIRESPTRPT